MARHLNTTHSFVNRVWRAHGLKPHLIRTFKLSNDPRFEEKLRDVVGLYLDPPHNAAVFSFDEKSQIQALDRTQPGLPMKKGRCATMTHDYKRHGTTTLFAALNMATGEVIGKTYRKHRHQEVLRFLREVEKTVHKEQEIHIVLDNYATHKHEKVLAWIERKKRVFLHFIPTSASWANLVERFFGILTQKQIRRGVFTRMMHKSRGKGLARPMNAGFFGPIRPCASSSQRVTMMHTLDRRLSRRCSRREGLCVRSTSR